MREGINSDPPRANLQGKIGFWKPESNTTFAHAWTFDRSVLNLYQKQSKFITELRADRAAEDN